MYYARFIYGHEEGGKIYAYYMKNAQLISNNIQFNCTISEQYFKEVRNIIQHIECNLFYLDNGVYYINHPYKLHPNKSIEYNDFLKVHFSFYENRGEFNVNDIFPTRLFFSKNILDPLIRKKEHNYFSTDFNHNNFTRRKEELYFFIKSNEEEILTTYKKDYRNLSRADFRTCMEEILQQKDSQHIIDSLWYDIRTESESTDKEI